MQDSDLIFVTQNFQPLSTGGDVSLLRDGCEGFSRLMSMLCFFDGRFNFSEEHTEILTFQTSSSSFISLICFFKFISQDNKNKVFSSKNRDEQ